MSEQTLQERLKHEHEYISDLGVTSWTLLDTIRDAAIRIDELERQLAEAQKDQADAKRYRWLRDDANAYDKAGPLVFLSGPRGEVYQIIHGQKLDDSLDYVIDAAIAQQKVKP